VSTKEEKEMEYNEWKEKFGHEWEKETSEKSDKDKEWEEYLHEFFKGRMS
jgi:hypothetical protein